MLVASGCRSLTADLRCRLGTVFVAGTLSMLLLPQLPSAGALAGLAVRRPVRGVARRQLRADRVSPRAQSCAGQKQGHEWRISWILIWRGG